MEIEGFLPENRSIEDEYYLRTCRSNIITFLISSRLQVDYKSIRYVCRGYCRLDMSLRQILEGKYSILPGGQFSKLYRSSVHLLPYSILSSISMQWLGMSSLLSSAKTMPKSRRICTTAFSCRVSSSTDQDQTRQAHTARVPESIPGQGGITF